MTQIYFSVQDLTKAMEWYQDGFNLQLCSVGPDWCRLEDPEEQFQVTLSEENDHFDLCEAKIDSFVMN